MEVILLLPISVPFWQCPYYE